MRTATKTIKRLTLVMATALVGAAFFAGPANAALMRGFDGSVNADSLKTPYTQAGGHPFDAGTIFDFERVPADPGGIGFVPVKRVRNLITQLPPGFIASPPSIPAYCTEEQLASGGNTDWGSFCPIDSQVGTLSLEVFGGISGDVPIFNMPPPAGASALFGFRLQATTVHFTPVLRSDGDYGINLNALHTSNAIPVTKVEPVFWGVPADPSHDARRGVCLRTPAADLCPALSPRQAFVRLPTTCTDPDEGLEFRLHADFWSGGEEDHSFFTHAAPFYPEPGAPGAQQGTEDCDKVPFDPTISAQPSAKSAESPSGLSVKVKVPTSGIENPDGIAQSDVKKAVVTLPEGITANPSQAEGLGVCSRARYESSELSFGPTPGKGCPDDSKIGTVEVHTPLLEETIPGDVYIARQDDPSTPAPGAENPFDSLLALYVVLAEPERGIFVKLAGEVEPDPKTGRLVTTFDDLPQLPFSEFEFRFREGARAPLVTPPACDTYTTEADFVPWSAQDPDNPTPDEVKHTTSTFEITSGVGGAPCPAAGVPPFEPGFEAGSTNNNAKSYTPFTMRLTRKDGEQDMTRFSSILPPGVLGKLAGVDKCPEASIALAATKTGRQEQAAPSCPANSQIGRIMAGAGVGSVLTYVGGKAYLAGPYNGDPLSVVVITPAVAGPFDVGTVVVREALTLNPDTAEVEVDGTASDPIPHILAGIPLKLRDLRVYVDRDNFILNPTSCDPSQVGATLFGSFLDVLSPADDRPVELASRFQAANCQSLPFKPALKINLKGGTKRGGHPSLKAVLNAREPDANIGEATVTLPRSAFLDQAHIRTICTRVQFAAGAGNGEQCPKGAQYGYARAFTPLLDEPIEGPVYLRSSNNKLPDLVAALGGIVDVNVVGRIDSFKGGIRSSFETVPDAPVSKFVLTMQGGRKGLVVNSKNLCAGTNRASASFTGQNGVAHDFRPVVKPSCGGKRKRSGRGAH